MRSRGRVRPDRKHSRFSQRLCELARPQCRSCAEFQKRYEARELLPIKLFQISIYFNIFQLSSLFLTHLVSLISMTTAFLSSAVQAPKHACISMLRQIIKSFDFCDYSH